MKFFEGTQSSDCKHDQRSEERTDEATGETKRVVYCIGCGMEWE